MIYSNWFFWIGLFAFGTIGVLIFKKPTKPRAKQGPFDNPIHTKPVFKYMSLFVLILVSFMFYIGTV